VPPKDGLNLIRGTVDDVHAAAIGLPAGDASREMFVGVGDAAVVLFLEFVFDGVRRGIEAVARRLR